MKRRLLWALALAGVVGLAGWPATRSEEPATPPPEQAVAPTEPPAHAEVLRAPAGPRMLAPEAEALMQRLRELALQHRPDGAEETGAATDEAEPQRRRVIDLDTPPVVNPTPLFLFRDVTGRRADRPQLTLEQRRAIAEVWRQSLLRTKRRAEEAREP